ncbi:membrane hypothetical protein [Bradyrhizobium sp. STM 3843]|uniref:hypothetical protein n=1 Tax=Bradyrhizobium sp. STM 3843 TaxID=551947 RepID=UPI000240AAB9|nr:hypothetical protein [Bradyrhizobium sp. STM 3843]CCE05528.1 membrane hypothetical protein [Bradyrhizobium sp. STM 3843]
MESVLRSLGKSVLAVLAAALICAFFILSPLISCDGGRQHCSERVLDAVPNTVVASPIILILVALFFFPSRWKDLLATLAVVAVGILALAGLIVMSKPRANDPEAEDRYAAFRYTYCLEGAARTVSQKSNDPPEAIAQTSFARCERWRKELLDLVHKHDDTIYPEVMRDAEQKFRSKLPQIIGNARG